MTDEHAGQSIYENGRFRLRTETDYAIIDELGEFPDIMINLMESDDGSESQYADRRGVLHLLNQLADTNPNEQRHYYLKYLLNKRHEDNEGLRNEIEWLKKEMTKLGIDHTEEITRLEKENEELKFLNQQLRRSMSRQRVRYKESQESFEERLRNNPMPTKSDKDD